MKLPKSSTFIACSTGLILAAGIVAACKKAPDPTASSYDKSSVADEAVEWEYKAITVTELQPVMLYEVFESAREAFAADNRSEAARNVKDAAAFFDRESQTREGDAQEAFVGYAEELRQLGKLLDSSDPVSKKHLNYIFARSHIALALENAAIAEKASKAGDRNGVGRHLLTAIEHSESALKWIGEKSAQSLTKEAREARETADKLKSGIEVGEGKADAAMAAARKHAKDAAAQIEAYGKETVAEVEKAVEDAGTAAKTETAKAVEKAGTVLEKAGEKIDTDPPAGKN